MHPSSETSRLWKNPSSRSTEMLPDGIRKRAYLVASTGSPSQAATTSWPAPPWVTTTWFAPSRPSNDVTPRTRPEAGCRRLLMIARIASRAARYPHPQWVRPSSLIRHLAARRPAHANGGVAHGQVREPALQDRDLNL